MSHADPGPAFDCPELLGAMMVALEIDLGALAEPWSGVMVRHLARRCLACPATGDCRRWLGGACHGSLGYRAFCPNAGLLERLGARPIRRPAPAP
jgi:hypothetical protein